MVLTQQGTAAGISGSAYVSIAGAEDNHIYQVQMVYIGSPEASIAVPVKVHYLDEFGSPATFEKTVNMQTTPQGGNLSTTLGFFRGVQAVELLDTSPGQCALTTCDNAYLDYIRIIDNGVDPDLVGYQSEGDIVPSGPMGTTFIDDVSITNLPIVVHSPIDKAILTGRDIVMLDDKDANGIKEFIVRGSIKRSNRFSLIREDYGSQLLIVSTYADGSVKSYQSIGFDAVKGTGFDIKNTDLYLRPVGDFDGNGTTDVLIVGQKFNLLLLDENDTNGYSVIGNVELSNAKGNLPDDMPGNVLFSSYQTEAYADADDNGVMDFITIIGSSANAQYVYAREQLGYTLARDITVLVLMNIDGTVKELKHFQSAAAGVYHTAGDLDGDGVVDLMHSSPAHGVYEIALMNSDFTIKEVKSFTVTKDGEEFGQGRSGVMIAAGDVDGNGIGDVLISNYPHVSGSNSTNSSAELVLLKDKVGGGYEVLSQTELVHSDDYMTNQYNNMGSIPYMTLSDMDGDGDLDFLIGHSGIGVHIRFFE